MNEIHSMSLEIDTLNQEVQFEIDRLRKWRFSFFLQEKWRDLQKVEPLRVLDSQRMRKALMIVELGVVVS